MKESDFRKSEKLCGKPVVLGNGEEWIISGLPLGKTGKSLMEKLLALGKKETELSGDVTNDKMSEYMDVANGFLLSVLQINYPDVTMEQVIEHDLFTLSHVIEVSSILRGF